VPVSFNTPQGAQIKNYFCPTGSKHVTNSVLFSQVSGSEIVMKVLHEPEPVRHHVGRDLLTAPTKRGPVPASSARPA